MMMGVSAAGGATAEELDSGGTGDEELAMPLGEEAAAGDATDRELVSRGEGGEEDGGVPSGAWAGGGGCLKRTKLTARTKARTG